MKKYYYIFSKVLLFISTIYLISGILDLTSISKKMIIYIFILNMTLELIRFIIFKENSNYEKKTIPSSIIYLNTINSNTENNSVLTINLKFNLVLIDVHDINAF